MNKGSHRRRIDKTVDGNFAFKKFDCKRESCWRRTSVQGSLSILLFWVFFFLFPKMYDSMFLFIVNIRLGEPRASLTADGKEQLVRKRLKGRKEVQNAE